MAQHDNHAARAAARKAEAKLKQFNHNIDYTLDCLLKSTEGRDFIWWLFDIGKVGQQPFSGNALTTSFGCGEMNVGNQILARIQSTNPEGYFLLLKEKQDAERPEPADGADAGSTYYGEYEPDT